MRSRIRSIVAFLAIGLGVIHIYFGICCRTFDMDALWFIGAGVAVVFGGLINFIAARSDESIVLIVSAISNSIMFLLFLAAFTQMRELQVVIGIALFGAALFLDVLRFRNQSEKEV